MANIFKVKGLPQVIANLKKKSLQMEGGIRTGLIRGGLVVMKAAQKGVPVDTGDLKASAFTPRYSITPKGIHRVQVGFTAGYGMFVHEAAMKLKGKLRSRRKGLKGYRGRYWDPQGSARSKFLQKALTENRDEIKKIVIHHAKL